MLGSSGFLGRNCSWDIAVVNRILTTLHRSLRSSSKKRRNARHWYSHGGNWFDPFKNSSSPTGNPDVIAPTISNRKQRSTGNARLNLPCAARILAVKDAALLAGHENIVAIGNRYRKQVARHPALKIFPCSAAIVSS